MITYRQILPFLTLFLFAVLTGCNKDDDDNGGSGGDTEATCSDGEKNQDENGVDCGGSCGPCDFDVACESELSNNEVEVGNNLTISPVSFTCTDQGSFFTIQGSGSNGGVTIRFNSRPDSGQAFDLVDGSFGPTQEGEASIVLTEGSGEQWRSQDGNDELFVGIEEDKFTSEFCSIAVKDTAGTQKQATGRIVTSCQ